jgi:hypothetical protein
MKPFVQKMLVIYSAVVSTALLCVVLMGAGKPREFDRLRVHRLDVVEPDGTMRMVISNKHSLPPVIIKGVERPEMGEPRPQAGMLFYNDEGTENGGLIFGGRKNESGEVVDSGGSLSFDQYGAGQVIQLAGVDDKNDQILGLGVNHGRQHVWLGLIERDTPGLTLTDANGKARIRMQVGKDGAPSIAFLDGDGRVVQQLAPRK